jgi:hypothetical protein
MKGAAVFKRQESQDRPAGYVGDHADKLGRVRPLGLDDDERPSREDRDYGQTIFTRGTVPLPRFLRPKAARRPPSR